MIAHLSIAHVSTLARSVSGGPYTGLCSADFSTLTASHPSATLYELHGTHLSAGNYVGAFGSHEMARAAWNDWKANGYFSAAEHAAATTHIPLPLIAEANGYSAQRIEIVCFPWAEIEAGRAWFFTNEGFVLDISVNAAAPVVYGIYTPDETHILNALL